MSVDRCRCIFDRKSTEGRHRSDFDILSYGRLTKYRFFSKFIPCLASEANGNHSLKYEPGISIRPSETPKLEEN